jgi:hypothetical protein
VGGPSAHPEFKEKLIKQDFSVKTQTVAEFYRRRSNPNLTKSEGRTQFRRDLQIANSD